MPLSQKFNFPKHVANNKNAHKLLYLLDVGINISKLSPPNHAQTCGKKS